MIRISTLITLAGQLEENGNITKSSLQRMDEHGSDDFTMMTPTGNVVFKFSNREFVGLRVEHTSRPRMAAAVRRYVERRKPLQIHSRPDVWQCEDCKQAVAGNPDDIDHLPMCDWNDLRSALADPGPDSEEKGA